MRTTPQRRRQKGTSRSCDKTRRRQKAGEPIASIAFWREPRNGFFWCNNNFDRWHTVDFTVQEQDDLQTASQPDYDFTDDYGHRIIPCTRDLEDFARLWICGVTSNLLAALPIGSSVTLSWGDVGSPNSSNPTIDLFVAADADGGIGYLTNATIAAQQTNIMQCAYVNRLAPGGSIQLNSLMNQLPTTHFIWCGVTNGSGSLTLTISDNQGNVLAQVSAAIQIVDIKQMYERWTVGDNPSIAPLSTPHLTGEGLPFAFQYTPPQDTNTPYILFVHGWNEPLWEKDRFAETAFKRLYWQGYQGRFGLFRWPTYYDFILGEVSYQAIDLRNFDNSEFNAWQSGAGLLNFLIQLNAEYPGHVYLFAHSHGNIVAGEALRLAGTNQVVNTYVAMQAAVSAHAYDPATPTRDPLAETPDCYAYYWTNGAPCYFNGVAGAGNYVNFCNTNDWALTQLWEPDQGLKPDAGYHYELPDQFYFLFTLLNFPTNTYEIFAFADEARSYALGAQANVGGKFFGNQVELGVAPYSFGNTHIYHSGEFRSDNAQRWQCWDSVLGSFGITR